MKRITTAAIVLSTTLFALTSCDDPVSSNNNGNKTSKVVSRTDVIGKWNLVRSVEAYRDANGVLSDAYYDVPVDTCQIIDITTEGTTFYTKHTTTYNKQVESFAFNGYSGNHEGHFTTVLKGDTLMMEFKEVNDLGPANPGVDEFECKYFIKYDEADIPSNWPTTETNNEEILFL